MPAGPQAPPPVAAAAAPEVPPGVVQAVLQPGGRLARPGMPAVRVRLIRINVKLLAQLAIMAFFVYQVILHTLRCDMFVEGAEIHALSAINSL